MTQEEKVKAYDEALLRAKNLHKDAIDMGENIRAKQCEIIFPELKESDDEKIRKAILEGIIDCRDAPDLGWTNFGGIEIDDCIAWLEKQIPIDKEKVLIGARKNVALSIMNFLDRNTLGMCLSNMECEDLEDAVVDSDWSKVYNYMKKKLEKQGGNLVENGYTNNKDFIKYADNYSHEIWHKLMDNFKNIKDYHIGCNDVSDIVLNAIIDTCNWLEKQGKETSWKPSKEEMDVLYGLAYITNQYDEHKEGVITRLYQDLKREFFNESSYENMFPTNTSTEDDVRRRSTIQVLEYARSLDAYNQYGKADIDKNIAWLEKQDNFSKKDVDDAYLKGVTDTKNEIEKQYEANSQIRKDIASFILNYRGDIKDRAKWIDYLGIKVSFVKKQDKQKPQGKSALEAINEKKVDNQNCVKPTDKVEPKFKIEKDKWYVCLRDLDDNYGTRAFHKGSTYYSTKDETLIPDNSNVPSEIKYYVNDYFRLWTIQDAKDGDVLAFDNNIIVIFKDLYNKTTFHSYCHIEDGVFSISEKDVPDWWNGEGFKPATKEQCNTLFAKMKEAGYKWDEAKKELKNENEKMLNKLIGVLDGTNKEDYHEGWEYIFLPWLKSLRLRNTWKPSDEQIESLEHFVRSIGESGYVSPYDNNTKLLYSLLEQLKKL